LEGTLKGHLVPLPCSEHPQLCQHSEPCPVWPWVSPGMGHPPPLWAAWALLHHPFLFLLSHLNFPIFSLNVSSAVIRCFPPPQFWGLGKFSLNHHLFFCFVFVFFFCLEMTGQKTKPLFPTSLLMMAVSSSSFSSCRRKSQVLVGRPLSNRRPPFSWWYQLCVSCLRVYSL